MLAAMLAAILSLIALVAPRQVVSTQEPATITPTLSVPTPTLTAAATATRYVAPLPTATPAPVTPAAYTWLISSLNTSRANHVKNITNAAYMANMFKRPVPDYIATEQEYVALYDWRLAVTRELLACDTSELSALIENFRWARSLHEQWAVWWETGDTRAANLGSEGPLQRVHMAMYDQRIASAQALAGRCY